MMEVVLNRLRDFSSKSSQFECRSGAVVTGGLRLDVAPRAECFRAGCTAGRGEGRLDIESALAWLRTELMEMRSQDQALIRQLMELHSGIQELKHELEEEEEEEEVPGERESSVWDSDSDHSSNSSQYSSSGEVSYLATPVRLCTRVLNKRGVIRRSSVP
ncbi:hypothetical protein NL108_013550 [Boleophthalmus pectinirostris]|uniref:uncharacterized protein si:ch211-153f2.3 n=1 Tax=Boleophthalmus pectinirostris TaxID=150288 RepID=UPI002432524F|nr:uncharacterized protein si:ch211-153f2.3 [Boleophthalmus pectinirostris]KAJ0055235.1 hypothetical protein NL108_013550 [Boleophthalmus pectinirostris]